MSEPRQELRHSSWSGISRPSWRSSRTTSCSATCGTRQSSRPRDRSLVTVAALIAGGNAEQLTGHLNRAKENGLTETELAEVIIHLAFYAGWPRAMSAIRVAREVFKR